MILIVTNRLDYTADYLILELMRRGARYVRFNTEDFPLSATVYWELRGAEVRASLRLRQSTVPFEEVRSVWYRRPTAGAFGPDWVDGTAREFALSESEAALGGIWRTLDCFWISRPDRLREAEFKLKQLQVATGIGFTIPPTIVSNDPEAVREFWQNLGGNVVFKPLRSGRLERDGTLSLIYTNPVDRRSAAHFDRTRYAPVLLQGYVPKSREIRVTIIGTRVFAVSIDSQSQEQSRHDWRRAAVEQLPHEPCLLPTDIEGRCIALVEALGLAFGAVDLVLTPAGEYVFLEINPNGQWAWLQQLCPNLPIRESLADLLISGGKL